MLNEGSHTLRAFFRYVLMILLGSNPFARCPIIPCGGHSCIGFFQDVEVVFVPVSFNHVKTVKVEPSREELEDVRFLGLEIPAGKEAQERHRQVFAISPLEVIHAVESGATAALDLK